MPNSPYATALNVLKYLTKQCSPGLIENLLNPTLNHLNCLIKKKVIKSNPKISPVPCMTGEIVRL